MKDKFQGLSAEIIARFLGKGKERQGRKAWRTTCPAHDDHDLSLAVCERAGKLMFRCHAGCSPAQVKAWLFHEAAQSKELEFLEPVTSRSEKVGMHLSKIKESLVELVILSFESLKFVGQVCLAWIKGES